MKKGKLINQPISAVIAGMGHGDELVIADAGLPIPTEPRRIDLALTKGIPSFLDTLRTVLSEFQVESAIVAEEMLEACPHVYSAVEELLADIPLQTTPHDAFKVLTSSARAIVRTGEYTPYSNIILVAGVVF